jgi:hypothetical protein
VECCQIDGIEAYMDQDLARKELRAFRKHGPIRTTEVLLDALLQEEMTTGTLLDVGGGIGAIQHTFLLAGSSRVTSVDASNAYLEAAREEASRNGTLERLHQLHGDFVKLADAVPEADVVTLDRVICCYGDMAELVRLSAERAKRICGLVYPRDHMLGRFLIWLENVYHKLLGRKFRAFMHPTEAVNRIIVGLGFERAFEYNTLLWQVHLYRRARQAIGGKG